MKDKGGKSRYIVVPRSKTLSVLKEREFDTSKYTNRYFPSAFTDFLKVKFTSNYYCSK